jgi:hypothetical protein
VIITEDDEIRFEANGPRINRSVTLRFLGDWGNANFTRIAGWLMQEFADRSGPHTRVFIGNSSGQRDTIRRVHRGEADLATTTPISMVGGALDSGTSWSWRCPATWGSPATRSCVSASRRSG